MLKFPKFTPAWNSTRFEQFLCPSSGVYSLYTRYWYMLYRLVDNFRAEQSWSCSKAVFKPVWHKQVPSVQWINSWWWAEELPETCRVSCRSKFGILVHLVGFIIKKFRVCVLSNQSYRLRYGIKLLTVHNELFINVIRNSKYTW
jgi:hypothetical protein